ncbi:MAG: tryptophan--tRNA ligase [Verrucomicrobiae bacterium]|nr:tryptophan--tRNA ligase [Verrucomicrobiae bacterium]
MRILSGIQPSGALHIGNYFGMMRPAIELQARGEAFLFIADLHALTTVEDPAELRRNTREVALDFLACGLDPRRACFFRQSDVPQVTELTWILSNVTPMSLLEKCHSYKDKIAKGLAPNHGLFAYPVLMASDILIYQSDIVPVGKDQKQHVEVTRDIAIKFNMKFGGGRGILKVPEADIRDEVAVVPGLDGQKMSKSYNNTIEIFCEENTLRKKVMGIVTDSLPVEAPKDPEKSHLYALYTLFVSRDEARAMAERFRKGGLGYGEVKKALAERMWSYFAPFRAKRAELAKDLAFVEDVLRRGAERAREEAEKTMKAVREAVGLR